MTWLTPPRHAFRSRASFLLVLGPVPRQSRAQPLFSTRLTKKQRATPKSPYYSTSTPRLLRNCKSFLFQPASTSSSPCNNPQFQRQTLNGLSIGAALASATSPPSSFHSLGLSISLYPESSAHSPTTAPRQNSLFTPPLSPTPGASTFRHSIARAF